MKRVWNAGETLMKRWWNAYETLVKLVSETHMKRWRNVSVNPPPQKNPMKRWKRSWKKYGNLLVYQKYIQKTGIDNICASIRAYATMEYHSIDTNYQLLFLQSDEQSLKLDWFASPTLKLSMHSKLSLLAYHNFSTTPLVMLTLFLHGQKKDDDCMVGGKFNPPYQLKN